MWDSYLHLYKKYKTFTKKYNVLFCPHYSLRIIPTSGMGLGRALCLNLWYVLGPSFTSQPLVWAWAKLYVSTSGIGLGRALHLNLWYGLGPSFTSQPLVWLGPSSIYPFYRKEWAIFFVGLFHILISPPPHI